MRSFFRLAPGLVEGYKAARSLLRERAAISLDTFQCGVAFREEGFSLGIAFFRRQAFTEGALRDGDVVVAFGNGARSNLEGLAQIYFGLRGPSGLVQDESQNR